MGLLSYIFKIKKISKNPNATAFFTAKEIVGAIVNLMDAKKTLSETDFFYVNVIFETYKLQKKKLLLNYKSFLGVCDEIIAHFDLVAPYHNFCGNNSYKMVADITDSNKKEYRIKATELIQQNKIFSPEWMSLHKDFKSIFYSEYNV